MIMPLCIGVLDREIKILKICKGGNCMTGEKAPSMDQWLQEAKEDPQALSCGMYMFNAWVVRQSARDSVREG